MDRNLTWEIAVIPAGRVGEGLTRARKTALLFTADGEGGSQLFCLIFSKSPVMWGLHIT